MAAVNASRFFCRTLICLLAILLVSSLVHSASFARTIEGKVTKVADGDTITVLDSDNEQHRVRIAGIDAPEKKQPFGNASKKRLHELVGGKEVRVEFEKYDRYQTDLEANAAGIVSKWCDMILFAKTDKIMRTEEAGFGGVDRKRADQVNTTRWIYTRATPTTPGGVRPEYAKLPEKLELDWAIFRAAVGDCLSQS